MRLSKLALLLLTFLTRVLPSAPWTALAAFLQYNNVPTEIPLGLFSTSSQIVNTTLVEGTCFNYDIFEFDRCKFYSDCCAMTSIRPREQLASGTFSCHDGSYIVDKCPPNTTDEKVRQLCDQPADEETGEII